MFLLLIGIVSPSALSAREPERDFPDDCAEFSERTLEVAGFGIAYFGEFSFSGGIADLFEGVCLESEARDEAGEPAWVVVVGAMRVDTNVEPASFEAEGARLRLPDWFIQAEALRSADDELVLTELTLQNGAVQGDARSARYDLTSEVTQLEGVNVRTTQYRVSGKEATLEADRMLFREALATTCVCENGELYVVVSPEADVDLVNDIVVVRDGKLKAGALAIGLGEELELSEERLGDLEFPITIAYSGPDDDDDGWFVRWDGMRLAEGVTLDTGLFRIGHTEGLELLALLRVRQPGTRVDFGLARNGFQADVLREEELLPWLTLHYGIRNRHWREDQDYLHEGFLRLEASEQIPYVAEGSELRVGGELLAAASHQRLNGDTIISPRLGAAATLTYRSPSTAAGRFSLASRAEMTHYSSVNQQQFAVRFEPSWRFQPGPADIQLGYDLRFTDSGSPFSTNLDRLRPRNRLSGEVSVAGDLAPGVSGRAAVTSRVAFGNDPEQDSDWARLRLSGRSDITLDEVTLTPRLTFETADLVGLKGEAFVRPALDVAWREWQFGVDGEYHITDEEASIGGRVQYERGDWLFRARARYGFDLAASSSQIDTLALGLGVPLRFGEVTVRPFAELNTAGLLNGNGGLELTGHGLEVRWENCCGTFTVSYLADEDTVRTHIGVAFPEGRGNKGER